jgi:predicted site-specific integrase-resolvase
MERLLTPQEVSKILGLSEWTILYGSLNGELPKVKVTKSKTMYRKQDVENYIRKNTERISCLR